VLTGWWAPRYHHLALDVDDFEAVFVQARDRGILDSGTWGAAVREHPAGWIHMYLRDPAGNLVEVVSPDAAAVDRSVVTGVQRIEEAVPQTGDAAAAVLHARDEPGGRSRSR
jgi:YD repeat-containing protein